MRSAFNSEEDYFKWDSYIAQLSELNLSEKERGQITLAINYLRNILGQNFLEEAFNEYHPFLSYYLLNSAPWVRRSLLRFTHILKSFVDSPDFDNLIKRIKRRSGFIEAHSVLEVGNKFLTAGFAVSFDSPVEVTDRQGRSNRKHPDIKLTDPKTGEEIYVEVTQLNSSRQQDLSSLCPETIWLLLDRAMDSEEGMLDNYQNRAFYLPYSRLHRILEEDELKNLVVEIKNLIEKVKTTKEFHELYIEGTFERAIAPPGKHPLVEEWAKRRNI